MRLPFLTTLGTLTLGLVLAGPFALPLHAEEGEEEGDPRAKIRAQIEKVLRLMAENEAALLKASTQGGNRPDGPDVPIPDLPPQGQPQGSGGQGGAGGQGSSGQGSSGQGSSGQGSSGQGSSGQGSSGQGGAQGGPEGEEAKRAIEELLKSAAEGGGSARIPGELEELIRMVPQGSSGGGGGEDPKGGGQQETPEAREARQRKQLEEQQRREQEEKSGKQPHSGERDPNDPASKDPETPPNPQNPNAKPWHATLPPELREFFAGGGLEKLPARLRKIVEDYQRSLDRQTGPAEGSSR